MRDLPNKKGSQPWNEDLSWVTEQLAVLSALEHRLSELRERHEFGVVYAVRPLPEGVGRIALDGPHVKWRGRISAGRIVAKASLHRNQPVCLKATGHKAFDRLMAFTQLKERSGSGNTCFPIGAD